ncbi:hypothetical protein [Nannocystis pusilla]|uniref:hypothetical protein n=1 Tax=Nannocystis pusilla TaxID=889268 RepID=UPI003DA3B1A9
MTYQARRFLVLRGDLASTGDDRALQPRSEIEARFESLWQTALEPALRDGHELTFAEVEARLGPHPLLKSKRRYRECDWLGAVFIARLSPDGASCEHLWPVSPRPDPRRLEIHFPDAAALARFRAAAHRARREPDELAACLLDGFAADAPAGQVADDAAQDPSSGPEAADHAPRRLPS